MSSSSTTATTGVHVRTMKVAGKGCIGLVARPPTVAEPGLESEILYEHCVKPSRVRHRSSAATGAVFSCSPCSIETTTLIVPKMSATKQDKSVQTIITKSTVSAAEATGTSPIYDASIRSGGGQSNEEVHTAEAEEVEEVGWSSDAPVTCTTSLSGRSVSCDSLSTWPPATTTPTTTGCQSAPASRKHKRRCPMMAALPNSVSTKKPLQLQQKQQQQQKKRRRKRAKRQPQQQQVVQQLEQPKLKAILAQADKEREALLSTDRSAEANSTQPQGQELQEQRPANQRMPLLAWSPGHRFDRPVRRAARKMSNFILFATLALALSTLLQWNFLAYHCEARGFATPMGTYRLY